MKNLISVSNGFGYRIFDDRNDTMRFLSKKPIDGIELMFISAEMLADFVLPSDVLKVLKSMNYVTIHAPFFDFCDNEETSVVLYNMQRLYNEIEAKNVTFHPDVVKNYEILSSYKFRVSIENNDKRKILGFQSPSEIFKLLDRYSFLNFTFDFAHAFQINPNFIDQFLNYKDRLSQVHLSYCPDELEEHVYLHKNKSRLLLEKLEFLKKSISSKTPLVLECVAINRKDLDLITNEIEFIRSI